MMIGTNKQSKLLIYLDDTGVPDPFDSGNSKCFGFGSVNANEPVAEYISTEYTKLTSNFDLPDKYKNNFKINQHVSDEIANKHKKCVLLFKEWFRELLENKLDYEDICKDEHEVYRCYKGVNFSFDGGEDKTIDIEKLIANQDKQLNIMEQLLLKTDWHKTVTKNSKINRYKAIYTLRLFNAIFLSISASSILEGNDANILCINYDDINENEEAFRALKLEEHYLDEIRDQIIAVVNELTPCFGQKPNLPKNIILQPVVEQPKPPLIQIAHNVMSLCNKEEFKLRENNRDISKLKPADRWASYYKCLFFNNTKELTKLQFAIR